MPTLRRYFIAGLLVWLPLIATIVVIRFLVNLMDRTLLLLPEAYRPEALIGTYIPGLGIALSLVVLVVTGGLAANFFGRRLVDGWESLLARIPLVRTIYASVKQVLETVFSASTEAFRRVVLVEYPRRNLWTLAFLTGTSVEEVQAKVGANIVNVFVPTTPNPTSGFFLMVPRDELIELDMSVEEGLKMIVSMGVVVPRWRGSPGPGRSALARDSDRS